MNDHFVAFDSVRGRVADVLGKTDLPSRLPPFYLVRNLRGRVRISVSEAEENDAPRRAALRELAGKLADALGPHGYPADDAVLFVGEAMLAMLQEAARPMAGLSHAYWVDRLLTGSDGGRCASPLLVQPNATRSTPSKAALGAAPPRLFWRGTWRARARRCW